MIARDGEVTHVAAARAEPTDTTGAGDAFAAGALYGLTHGLGAVEAARIGTRLAAHVVSRMGPRPDRGAVRDLSLPYDV
jgi:sugar/nucleoside kinase (ribokinase family)